MENLELDIQKALDECNAQIVQWQKVPDTEGYSVFMYSNVIAPFERLIVKTLFSDGSGSVDISYLIPTKGEDDGIIMVWKMSDYARANDMKITHYMKLPKPPVK